MIYHDIARAGQNAGGAGVFKGRVNRVQRVIESPGGKASTYLRHPRWEASLALGLPGATGDAIEAALNQPACGTALCAFRGNPHHQGGGPKAMPPPTSNWSTRSIHRR